ncbi:MAG: alpha/beta hydrolase [Chitinophagaceae bacterium]|nr:MAG: alpha/beta hydrolase [Chitinophagaceae bacterium]
MKKYKELYIDSNDGLKLFCRCFIPEIKPKKVVIIVHGLGEHSGRYEEFIRALNKENYGVYSYDQRGHGVSDGQRGHSPDFNSLLNDLDRVFDAVIAESKPEQIFLFGHSMGGNVAANYLLKRKNDLIKASILSSPWIELAFEPPAYMLFLAKSVGRIFPSFSQSTKLDVHALSKQSEEVKKYIEDPLVHDKITAGAYLEIFGAGKNILLNADKLNIPILLMHGKKDKITSFESSKKVASANVGKVKFLEFENGYHELLHDEEKTDFTKEVIEFLKSV